MSKERDEVVKRLHAQGMSRTEVRQLLGIGNNTMSGLSARIGIVWGQPKTRTTRAVKKSPSLQEKMIVKKLVRKRKLVPPPTRPRANPYCILPTGTGQPTGPVTPIHQSAAFPRPNECGLSEGILLALARMYAPK